MSDKNLFALIDEFEIEGYDLIDQNGFINDLDMINEEMCAECDDIDNISELIDSAHDFERILTSANSGDELEAILRFADPEGTLRELDMIPSASEVDANPIAAMEAIELKVGLTLEDTAKLWKMLRPFLGNFAKRYQKKRDMFAAQIEQSQKSFNRPFDEMKYANLTHSSLLDAKSLDGLVKSTKGIVKLIPNSMPIIKVPNEYNRMIKSFNFNQDALALSIKMGKFVSAGKSKMKNKQFYRQTEFAYVYQNNVSMQQAGYRNDNEALNKTYDAATKELLASMDHVIKAVQSYAKDIKPIGQRLSNMTNNANSDRVAGLQVKLISDYLRVIGQLFTKYDIIFNRMNSVASAASRIKGKKA